MNPVIERFLRYVQYDTTSCEESTERPSTPGQLVFADVLAEEMKALGISNVRSKNAYVYGEIPATSGCEDQPAIGLIAHLDTAPAASGKITPSRYCRPSADPAHPTHRISRVAANAMVIPLPLDFQFQVFLSVLAGHTLKAEYHGIHKEGPFFPDGDGKLHINEAVLVSGGNLHLFCCESLHRIDRVDHQDGDRRADDIGSAVGIPCMAAARKACIPAVVLSDYDLCHKAVNRKLSR